MKKSPDVQLVMMPWQAVERPSPALGLLVAVTREAGRSVAGRYPGFRFAERIGLERYMRIAGDYLTLTGEWIFSGAAFPGEVEDAEGFFRLITDTSLAHSHKSSSVKGPGELLELRALAWGFVEEEADRIVELAPRVVGCGSQFQQQCASLALLRAVKARNPAIITLLGGQCCSGDQGAVLKELFPWLDIVFSGEADGVLPALLEQLFTYGPAIPRSELLPGVIAEAGYLPDLEGHPQYAITPDMNQTPVPDHDDYFKELAIWRHRKEIHPYIPFEGGRGCAWAEKTGGCSFCATASERAVFRPKSPQRLRAELDLLSSRYSISAFEAADEMCNPEFLQNFFPALAAMETPPFLLSFDVRASLSGEEVALMRDAGCVWLQPGIESLSDGALKIMRKGLLAATAVRLLRLAREQGISTSWNILRGFPGEKALWYGEMSVLVPALVHLEPPGTYGRMRIDRNSLYQREPGRFGLRLSPAPHFQQIYPLGGEAIERLAFFFVNETPVGLPADAPEHYALEREIVRWRELFYGAAEERPSLTLERRGEVMEVVDTRPCALARHHRLSAEEVKLLELCRDPMPEEVIRNRLEPLYGPERLHAALRTLSHHQFLLPVGRRWITVVMNPPRFPLPTPEEVLAGTVPLRRRSEPEPIRIGKSVGP